LTKDKIITAIRSVRDDIRSVPVSHSDPRREPPSADSRAFTVPSFSNSPWSQSDYLFRLIPAPPHLVSASRTSDANPTRLTSTRRTDLSGVQSPKMYGQAQYRHTSHFLIGALTLLTKETVGHQHDGTFATTFLGNNEVIVPEIGRSPP
jgi:hypothetical protein